MDHAAGDEQRKEFSRLHSPTRLYQFESLKECLDMGLNRRMRGWTAFDPSIYTDGNCLALELMQDFSFYSIDNGVNRLRLPTARGHMFLIHEI